MPELDQPMNVTDKAAESTVDYTLLARTAHAQIVFYESEITRFPQVRSKCREQWRDFGHALLEKRRMTPSNVEYGGWIKGNGLAAGPTESHAVRADAAWLAEQWTNVQSLYNGQEHHPTSIRQACRHTGFAWAFETEHQRERKANSRRTRAKVEPPKLNRKSAVERAEEIRVLAKDGHASHQIATRLQIADYRVRELAREHSIELPDATIGKRHRREPLLIARDIVGSLAGCAHSIEILRHHGVFECDSSDAVAMLDMLNDALRQLRWLKTQLERNRGIPT